MNENGYGNFLGCSSTLACQATAQKLVFLLLSWIEPMTNKIHAEPLAIFYVAK
jgi:hypothetical protein